jgi:hypothetical protein|tara:strand:- start:256 stop:432 length:177 start_codon:yes stop_codon:yes gene_type:complete
MDDSRSSEAMNSKAESERRRERTAVRDRWLSKVPTLLVALVSEKIERNTNTDKDLLRQ